MNVQIQVEPKELNMEKNEKTIKQLLICGCENGKRFDDSTIAKIRASLDNKRICYTYANDLCGMATNELDRLKQSLFSDDLTVLACAPHAVRTLLNGSGACDENKTMTCHAISDLNIDDFIDGQTLYNGTSFDLRYERAWSPWFPVIDSSSCNHCGKCLNFCLFGVYSKNAENLISVSSPENCKDKCPACARICPTGAIIFPKSIEPDINGGKQKLPAEFPEIHIAEKLSDDLYATLAARRDRSGRILLKKVDLEKATRERELCSGSGCDCDCSRGQSESGENCQCCSEGAICGDSDGCRCKGRL